MKPVYYPPLVKNLSKKKRKRDSEVVGIMKRLTLKYKDVILKKSLLDEKEEKKEDVEAPE